MSATYGTLIYSTGDPVVINGEDCVHLGGGRYQIEEESRRLLDPRTSVAAYDTVNDSEIVITSIDYFNGIVTLANEALEDVQLDCAYVTKQLVGASKSYSYEITGDVFDETTFASAQASGGYRSRSLGLHDISLSIDNWDDLAQKFKKHKRAKEMLYMEVRPGGGNLALKGWFIVETDAASGDVGALEEESISFMLASLDGNQQDGKATVFSFS